MKSEVVGRLVLGLLTYTVVAGAIYDPWNPLYLLVRMNGTPAALSLLVLTAAATLGLWDAFWNDIWTGPMVSERAKRFRQGTWMVVSLTYLGYAVILLKNGVPQLQAGIFLIYGGGAVAVAFSDAFAQIKLMSEGKTQ
jgi:hypothetical protein